MNPTTLGYTRDIPMTVLTFAGFQQTPAICHTSPPGSAPGREKSKPLQGSGHMILKQVQPSPLPPNPPASGISTPPPLNIGQCWGGGVSVLSMGKKL